MYGTLKMLIEITSKKRRYSYKNILNTGVDVVVTRDM